MRNYTFYRHCKSGEVWAIQFDEPGNIIGVCGPLPHRIVDETAPNEMDRFEYTSDDVDYIESRPEEFEVWER